jgi:hypothetical protein
MSFRLSLGLGYVEVGLLGCWSVMVRLRDAIEVVIVEEMSLFTLFTRLIKAKTITTAFCMSNRV